MESAFLVWSCVLLSFRPLPGLGCMWRECDQIRLPNPADGNMLEVYNCGYRPRDRTTFFTKRCQMPPDIRNLLGQSFRFRMTDTSVRTFPMEICPFTDISELDFQRNHLQLFPNVSSSCLIGLRRLLLNANRLKALDLTLVLRLKSLEELEVEDNALETITLSTAPPTGSRLRILKAARSRLKAVDISILRIISLTTVDLSLNSVGRIENRQKWSWRTEASEVNRKRRFKAVSGPVSDNYRLKLRLLLRGNFFKKGFQENRLWGFEAGRLQDAATVLTTLLDLQRLFAFVSPDVAGGRVECDCHAAGVLDLLHNHLTPKRRAQVGLGTMDALINLKCSTPDLPWRTSLNDLLREDLFCVHPSPNCPSKCACTEFLNGSRVLVNCSRAGMQVMPGWLPKPFQPKAVFELDLKDNDISGFNKTEPAYAASVTRIDLRGNRITSNSSLSVFANFARLQELDLRNNPIKHLREEILNLTDHLAVLKLSAERLACSCDDFQVDNLHQILKIFPTYYDFYCLLGNVRQRVRSFRRHMCVSETGNSHNGTRTNVVYKVIPSFKKWLISVVASVSAVIILVLFISTGVVLYRFLKREKRKKMTRIRRPASICESSPPCSTPPVLGPLNLMPRTNRFGSNLYIEHRTFGWSSTFQPGEDRVALVHPTMSIPSLRDSFGDDAKVEGRPLNRSRPPLLENPPTSFRSLDLLRSEEVHVTSPSPPPPPSPYPASRSVRRMRASQSLPRVPPPPPPRENSVITRPLSQIGMNLPPEFAAEFAEQRCGPMQTDL